MNNLALDLGALQARYGALQQQLAPSVHRYNTYWNSFEASGQPASDQPLACPSDYTLVPADASGLVANGGAYNQFRWRAAQPVLALDTDLHRAGSLSHWELRKRVLSLLFSNGFTWLAAGAAAEHVPGGFSC